MLVHRRVSPALIYPLKNLGEKRHYHLAQEYEPVPRPGFELKLLDTEFGAGNIRLIMSFPPLSIRIYYSKLEEISPCSL